jgi:hypothetical protein
MGKGEEERGAPAAGETRRWGFPESGAAAQTSDCDQSQADRDPPTSDYAAAYNEQVPGSASTHTDSSSPVLPAARRAGGGGALGAGFGAARELAAAVAGGAAADRVLRRHVQRRCRHAGDRHGADAAPTESRIVWLQQFGRGLRKVEDKTLRVIDYIGNHRVFLTKVQALLSSVLGIGESHQELREYVLAIERAEAGLPAGCEVTYDLQVIDVLKGLLRPTTSEELLREAYEEFRFQHGRRPTAREMFMSGGLQRETLRRGFGSWFGLVGQMGDLRSERAGGAAARRVPRRDRAVAHGAQLQDAGARGDAGGRRAAGCDPDGCAGGAAGADRGAVAVLAARSWRRRCGRRWVGRSDAEEQPAARVDGDEAGEGSEFFELDGDRFGTRFGVDRGAVGWRSGDREALPGLARELVEWRLAEYVSRADLGVEAAVPPGAEKQLRVGASLMREEIPPLLGSTFSRTVWQQGIVAVPSGLALLVTLGQAGQGREPEVRGPVRVAESVPVAEPEPDDAGPASTAG